jgi:hypothetical protein
MSLVRSAHHGPAERDVSQFSEWYDPASVDALFGTLLTSTDIAVLGLAMDSLGNKPITDASLNALLKYVDRQDSAARLRYASFVGSIGLREKSPPDAVRAALDSINGFGDKGTVCRVLLEQGDVKLIHVVLDVYGSSINPDLLLFLLGHRDRDIRLKVLPLVKGVSLTSPKQALQSCYSKEQDPAVRALYEHEVPELIR